nr:tetratricopeptide repeat protein [uncultured Arsenicibacter sp.]
MKHVFTFLIGLCCLVQLAYGQNNSTSLMQSLRYLKTGNSLREAQQYDKADEYLTKALTGVKAAKHNYWTAAVYENLGLLARDRNDMVHAGQYLNQAIDLYQAGGYTVSEKVLRQILSGLKETEELYGGIDIGAKGVKLSVVALKFSPDGHALFRVVKSETRNTTPIECTPAVFAETAKAVHIYLDSLMTRRKLTKNRIFVVGSSGLQTALVKNNKQADLEKALHDELGSAWPTAIPFIDAAGEAELTVRGTIPRREWLTTSTIDIGSGNTKGGYFTTDNTFDYIDFPGTVSMLKKIQEGGKPVDQSAQQVYTDELQSVVKREMGRKAGFQNRQRVYMMGGIVYALVTYLHPREINTQLVKFTYKDAVKLQEMAIQNYDALTNPDLSGLDNEEAMRKAQADIKTVREKVFKRDEIIAGATMLRGVLEECRRSRPEAKEFIFPRGGVIGWISGYIIQSIEKEYREQKAQ